MRNLHSLFATMAFAVTAQDYPLGPDSQPNPSVPKGTVIRSLTLAPGKFYPGTPHTYGLYIPAGYDASKPTPFMIFLDGSGPLGNQQRVPVVFDNLIAKGEIPPLIGIFIDPGVLPALSDQVQNRYERVFEYDSLSDRFARFLSEDLIPEVGRKYNLSKNPDDHAIAGVSTGAVGAFVAAWQRPDLFHRVLSFIGTFVHMKGADSLPALIRRTEPKPLRIFLEAGRNDHIVASSPFGNFFAGSWPINNQLMYEALQFTGYDVRFELGENAHNMTHGSAIMPEAIRWLWREYPKPIVPREPAAMTKPGWEARGQIFSLVSLDKPWDQVSAAATSVATNKDGELFWADPTGSGRIHKADAGNSVFRERTGAVSVLRFGADERLYAAQPSKHRIVSFGAKADEKVVASGVDVQDMAITAKGVVYYVDVLHGSVGMIEAGGKHRVLLNRNEDMPSPSAISLAPDHAMLIVADSQSRFAWSYQIAADGTLINGEPFYRVDMPEVSWRSGVNGVTVDSTGQVYFATALGVQYCEQNGRCAGIASKPGTGPITSVAFGGKDLSSLYITQGTQLFRRPVKTKGVGAWAPIKTPKPPL